MANYYYSGQGSLYAAERDAATGKPKGFVAVGNVPELSLDIAVTKAEHKESESGSRLLDVTLIKETKGTFKFKLENLSLDNLAMGLYGAAASVAGASVTGEAFTAYLGMRCPLVNPKVSAVVITAPNAGAPARASTTAYTVGQYYTPVAPNGHYYQCTVAGTSGASLPTFTTNGTTFLDGATCTFKDMGTTTKTVTTDYTVDATNGVITPVVGGGITDLEPLAAAYTFTTHSKMEAFTSSTSPERYLRFEGMNTVDGTRVIIDMYKAQFDPLTNYALLGDDVASVDMAGSLLSDAFIVSGSKFFKQRNLPV